MGGGVLDFVVLGAQRAGSTGFARRLASHPQLFVPPDEVPYFEDPFYAHSSPSELARALRGARPGQRRGIHRPEYLAREECAPRIAADAPDARLLAVLRDPVERAVAGYCWYVQFGLLPVVPVELGLQRLLDGWSDPAHPRAGDVLEYGRYGRHLRRYVDRFGADRVLALRSDALDDPETYRRVFAFIEVEETHRPPAIGRRTNVGAYDMRRLRWLRLRAPLAHSWAATDVYRHRRRRWRRPVAFVPTAFVVAVDRVLLARLFPGRPSLPVALEARVRDWYAEDLDELASLVGWDVAGWRHGARRA
jgi:hypothetical protein